MKVVRIPEAIYGDVTIFRDCGDEVGLSDECISFINKLCKAKMKKERNAKWYEVNATDDEVIAIGNEIMIEIIARQNEELEQWYLTTSERADIRRYIGKVKKWLDANMEASA